MKIAQKIMEMIYESANDIHNIADYLSNALEHEDSIGSSIKYMKKEFGLSDNQVTKVLSWWDKQGPKGQLALSLNARKMTSELEKLLEGNK